MSCTFALAIPQLSVVCADTRISFGTANGDGANDIGSFIINYKDRVEIPVKDYDRKIRRYPGGWATGSGSFAVAHSCLTRLSNSNARTPVTISSTLQQAFQQISKEMRDDLAAGGSIDPTTILYVYNTINSFRLGIFSIDERIPVPAVQQYYLSTPNDISRETIAAANAELQKLSVSSNDNELPQFIVQIAKAFHIVHQASATVSDFLDMAISIRRHQSTIQHFRLFETNEFLIHAEDEQMLSLLKPTK